MRIGTLALLLLSVGCGAAGTDTVLTAPKAPPSEKPVVEVCADACLTFDSTPLADASSALDGCAPREDAVESAEGIRLVDLQLVERVGDRVRLQVTFGNVDARAFTNYPGVVLEVVEGSARFEGDRTRADWPLFAMFGCDVHTTEFVLVLPEPAGTTSLQLMSGSGFFEAVQTLPVELEWVAR